MTADDLKELGVTAIGHRRLLLKAIADLAGDAERAGAADASAPPPLFAAVEVERRQLTVMFCDLVGSTPLALHFDPEDLRDILGTYHRSVADTVVRFDGFVAKYMGDGVLIYFGYPQAHEEDAERAVRAGLALIEAVDRLEVPERLQVRMGIASGLVVVGDLLGEGAAQERSVFGETPNLAARLQGLAAANQIVVADDTRHLLGGLFEVEDLGPQILAGFVEPQRAWRVLGESGVLSRFEALRSSTTPLVGRDEELDLLRRRWQQAKTSEGRVVLISGEPGIGKSRLTAALSHSIEGEPHTRLRYFCSPHHQDSALYPFIAQIERAAAFSRTDAPEEKRARLDALLAAGVRDPDEITLIAELLSLPNAAADLKLSPQRKRDMLLHALLHQLETIAARQPVLMVFEDAHWIDPTSRELLDLAIDRLPRLPVLLVTTFRPEFRPAWSGQPHVTALSLNRLVERDGAALVEQLAGGSGVTPEVVAEIVERTDGVPLFIEELTKAVLESGGQQGPVLAASPTPGLAIPATLHASLIARLDRLGTAAKETAQIGAVIGREFSYDLIVSVVQRAESDLRIALGQLTDAGLLFCRGLPPHASYLFKHALVQDAAYATLLRARRRELHARLATVLRDEYDVRAEARPELLAHHYTEAGQAQDAAIYWGRAARRSAARSAMTEAAAQFQKGLEQLKRLPDNRSRRQQELEILATLGGVMQGTAGNASPERGRVYARARQLWEELGYPPEFLNVPYGQALFHVYCGELETALRLGRDLLRLSQLHRDARGLILSHNSLGMNLMIAGSFREARSYLEEIPRLYSQVSRGELIALAGTDPLSASRSVLANVLFCLGYPDRAREHIESAVEEAEGLGLLRRQAGTLTFSCRLFSVSGDNAALGKRADQLLNLAVEQRFPLWAAEATMYRGWAKASEGETEEGLGLLQQGARNYLAVGHEAGMSHYISLMARAHALAGRVDEGLPLLDQALRIVEATGEGRFLAELNRHKGEFLLKKGKAKEAEALFNQALSIAREQQAKMWELRTATSLAGLLNRQSRREEAREVLAPVHGWFTEGFDTADLKEAKVLLDRLG